MRSLSAASAPLDVPSLGLSGFSIIVTAVDADENVLEKTDDANSAFCCGVFIVIAIAFLLAILSLSATSAPLDVPSLDLIGFSITGSMLKSV